MKVLNNIHVKLFIYELLLWDDAAGVDGDGNRIRYKSYPKNLYKAYFDLKNLLQEHIDVYLYPKSMSKNDLKQSDLTIVTANDFMVNSRIHLETKAFLAEVFRREDDLLLNDSHLDVIRYYYSLKKEIPANLSVDNFKIFEELIK